MACKTNDLSVSREHNHEIEGDCPGCHGEYHGRCQFVYEVCACPADMLSRTFMARVLTYCICPASTAPLLVVVWANFSRPGPNHNLVSVVSVVGMLVHSPGLLIASQIRITQGCSTRFRYRWLRTNFEHVAKVASKEHASGYLEPGATWIGSSTCLKFFGFAASVGIHPSRHYI